MPALLREEEYAPWLETSLAEAPGLLNTFGSDDLQAHALPAIPPRPEAGVPAHQRSEPVQRALL